MRVLGEIRLRAVGAEGKLFTGLCHPFRIAALCVLLCGASVVARADGLPITSCHSRLAAAETESGEATGASFALQFGSDVSPYPLVTTVAMPAGELEIEVVLADRVEGAFEACADLGVITEHQPGRWLYRAPSAGDVATVGVLETATGTMLRLRVLVLTPYFGQETLEGYRIGAYRQKPLRDLEVYRPPIGLFRVDPDDVDLAVSPSFRLGQFLSKQESGYPKFVLVSARLLLKLERLLEVFNEAGIEASTLAVMSAFRTPHYNQSIGNRTSYSRHLYGDAADVYIDEDGDDRMDDLDGDGKSDLRDAQLLAEIVESLREQAWYGPLIGGLGIYGPAPHRGPFIHVDTRGSVARWSSP